MTSFTWKKKAGKQLRDHAKRWLAELSEDDFDEIWSAKPKKVICLEDAAAKAARLENEAVFYVQNERYADGLRRLQEAIELKESDARLHDMLSQIYQIRGEDFLAVQSAQKAVECSPLWSDAHQTLGRALLNFGEVKLVRLFCHLFEIAFLREVSPLGLRSEDLPWALSVLTGQATVSKETGLGEQQSSNAAVVRKRDFLV
ncbi:tetratricopeptide repeat protein 33 [Trichuris trichiura]|uniref:Tetratricopeptide repeat protein 33 n=1 Tax=Trichuris trichiura TaxID=36087 RepID=A0A077Z7H9_TRITR|nr:tetratricopeptide repeat protein 33 [Trichuris trichiura]